MSQVDQLSQSNGFDFLGFPSIFLRSIHSGQKDIEVFCHPKDYSSRNHWNVESSDSEKTTPAGRICVDFWEMKVNSVTAVFAAELVRSVQSTHHYTQTVVLHGSAKPQNADLLHCSKVFSKLSAPQFPL